jgi:hypothetical protein
MHLRAKTTGEWEKNSFIHLTAPTQLLTSNRVSQSAINLCRQNVCGAVKFFRLFSFSHSLSAVSISSIDVYNIYNIHNFIFVQCNFASRQTAVNVSEYEEK